MHSHALLGGHSEGINQARNLAPTVFDGLACFDAEGFGKLIEALSKTTDTVIKDVLALVGGHLPQRPHGGLSSTDSTVNGLRIRKRNPAGNLAGVFVNNLKIEIGGLGLIRQVVRVTFFHTHDISLDQAGP